MDQQPSNDLQSRLDAYAGLTLEELRTPGPIIPRTWTPERVAERVVDAMKIAQATAGRIGPSSSLGFWPAIFHTVADQNGWDLDNPKAPYYLDRRREISQVAARRFDPEEMSMADEALVWIARYLSDRPLQSDALTLWSWCTARGADPAPVLRARRDIAEAMRERYRASVGAAVITLSQDDRLAQIARAVAKSANILIAEAEAARRRARSDKTMRAAKRQAVYAREWAAKKLLDAVKAEKLITTVDPLKVTIHDLMPGRVFHRQTCLEHRKAGAATIAAGLQTDGVRVR